MLAPKVLQVKEIHEWMEEVPEFAQIKPTPT